MSGGMGGEATGASVVLTTKGDIVGYDTARKRIGVGVNDQILTADSTNANGLAWKTSSGASLGSNVFTGSQTIPPNIIKSQGIAGLAGLTLEPTATNATQNTCFNPSGTANRSQITITRQSDPTVNADILAIGGDIYNTSTFTIRTYASGTGTARDLQFFHGTSHNANLLSDGFGITATKKLYLDGGTNTYWIETANDNPELFAGATRKMGYEASCLVSSYGTTAVADGNLNNKDWSVSVNEAGNVLNIKVKYSNGTVKNGTVALS
jgi:hypothetical protein